MAGPVGQAGLERQPAGQDPARSASTASQSGCLAEDAARPGTRSSGQPSSLDHARRRARRGRGGPACPPPGRTGPGRSGAATVSVRPSAVARPVVGGRARSISSTVPSGGGRERVRHRSAAPAARTRRCGRPARRPGPPSTGSSRRPGGQGVGLGEGVQQLQGRRSPTAAATAAIGGRVGEVAPGGDVGQQQVVADQRHEHVDVVRREPHAGGDPARPARRRRRVWSPGDSPCRCRAARRRPAAGRGGRPGR